MPQIDREGKLQVRTKKRPPIRIAPPPPPRGNNFVALPSLPRGC